MIIGGSIALALRQLVTLISLLWGSFVFRPYVYFFFFCFIFLSIYHLRWKGCVIYIFISYLVAFACEYSSTRNGFPFGYYVYLDETRIRELWISNIPFWDSLSFVFLSYFSWILAAVLRKPFSPSNALMERATTIMGGVLMMLLDVVIDPVALRGDRWFLGKIYDYPNGGSYFGVTLSNFFGWFFVGSTTLLLFQKISRMGLLDFHSWRTLSKRFSCAVFSAYSAVMLFNLFLTVWIGEWLLCCSSALVTFITVGVLCKRMDLFCFVRRLGSKQNHVMKGF